MLGTSASSSTSPPTAILNIGPATGEAGAPAIVLTDMTRPAAGARRLEARPAPATSGTSLASSWFSVTLSPSRTNSSDTFEPSPSTPATASRRGTMKPVTRTVSEKQALVALTTCTIAPPGVTDPLGEELSAALAALLAGTRLAARARAAKGAKQAKGFMRDRSTGKGAPRGAASGRSSQSQAVLYSNGRHRQTNRVGAGPDIGVRPSPYPAAGQALTWRPSSCSPC